MNTIPECQKTKFMIKQCESKLNSDTRSLPGMQNYIRPCGDCTRSAAEKFAPN